MEILPLFYLFLLSDYNVFYILFEKFAQIICLVMFSHFPTAWFLSSGGFINLLHKSESSENEIILVKQIHS